MIDVCEVVPMYRTPVDGWRLHVDWRPGRMVDPRRREFLAMAVSRETYRSVPLRYRMGHIEGRAFVRVHGPIEQRGVW